MQKRYLGIRNFILLAHAFGGTDTTSSMFSKGKKQVLNLLATEVDLQPVINIFNDPAAKHEDIGKAGEQIFVYLYSGQRKKTDKFLNELRFEAFATSLKKKSCKLESLPPTEAAAKFHSYRVYLQIQIWLTKDRFSSDSFMTCNVNPEQWGWEKKNAIL